IVALLVPWKNLIDVPFATAVAFEGAFGSPWIVRLIMLGAVLSLLKVLNGNFLAATRLLYAMGSKEMLGGLLGQVHPRFQTPAPAILLVGLVAVLTIPLGETILEPISEVGSLTCALGWLAACLAYCWGAGGSLSLLEWLIGLVGIAVTAAFVIIVAKGFGRYEWLVSAAWTACGLVLWLRRDPMLKSSE